MITQLTHASPIKKITHYVIIPLVTHYEKPLIVTLWLWLT